MYPDELKEFIESKNYCLGGTDLKKATSIIENPQLNSISYNNGVYNMSDCYGNNYIFQAIPFEYECEEEEKIKRLK